MNKLVQLRKKIMKAERLHQAKLLATKNGETTPYRRTVYQERVKKIQEELASKNV